MCSLFHSSSLLLLIIGFLFVDISTSVYDEDANITYPFREDGRIVNCEGQGFELECTDKKNPVMEIMSEQYRVLKIDVVNRILTVVRTDIIVNDGCPGKLANTTLNFTLFDYANSKNLTFVSNCSHGINLKKDNIICRSDHAAPPEGSHFDPNDDVGFYFDPTDVGFYVDPSDIQSCKNRTEVPVLDQPLQDVRGALRNGFGLKYTQDLACVISPGHCFYYPEAEEELGCNCVPIKPKKDNKLKLVLGLSIGCPVIIIITCCFFFNLRQYCKKKDASSIIYFSKEETLTHQNVEAFLRSHGPLAIRRYSYSNIKRMTNSFRDKLGQGGYGGVFKGELKDGCLVAVKVLKESKGDGEEFINEVASISRTSHVNIVTLMGFCFEGSNRALIYEFMPNGSLEKFIYKENPSKDDRQLGWETLYKVAIGIARGLEYLHQGCNTRILHFDIKPHNILLDEEFCPKISDFGLAKICPRKESIISMVGARGTVGFIAPEVFCRNFGGVSHKSDVYSYGMMVLEMVGGRKNFSDGVDRISEIYFPHWIYKRLEVEAELGLKDLMNEKDEESVRKMIIVGLWCIQTDPSIRPTISKVVEMLEGSLNSLQIPPKPFLSSPSRSPADSSTVTVSLQ